MTTIRTRWLAALALASTLLLGGCGYNDFQRLDEQVKAAWSEVLNQYQRRADLIPNIVATVKGEANFEQDTLTKVIEARSRATSIQATPELVNDPAAFEQVPAGAGRAHRRAVAADGGGRGLPEPQGQPGLSRTCACSSKAPRTASPSRATATSRRWPDYNVLARSFPTNLTAKVFGYDAEAQLHGAERGADLGAADGELRQAGGEVAPDHADRAADSAMRHCAGLPTCCCWRTAAGATAVCGAVAQAQDVLAGAGARPARVIDQTATLDAAQRAGARSQAGARSRPSAARRSSC